MQVSDILTKKDGEGTFYVSKMSIQMGMSLLTLIEVNSNNTREQIQGAEEFTISLQEAHLNYSKITT